MGIAFWGVPRLSETTGTIEMKIGKSDLVGPRAPHAKWGHPSFCGGYVAEGRKFQKFLFLTIFFFDLIATPTEKAPEPIFTRDIPKDVAPEHGCPFGGRIAQLQFFTPFTPKNLYFGGPKRWISEIGKKSKLTDFRDQ